MERGQFDPFGNDNDNDDNDDNNNNDEKSFLKALQLRWGALKKCKKALPTRLDALFYFMLGIFDLGHPVFSHVDHQNSYLLQQI